MTYDWRKSSVEAAAGLERCVAEVQERTGAEEMDFVAYSLGGLVFRAWLAERQPEPERAFHRAVLIGTPLRGTLMSVELMVADTHPLFGLARRIWRTLRSFPCVYEMLPTYPGAVLTADGADVSGAVFEPKAWPSALTALPPEADPIRPLPAGGGKGRAAEVVRSGRAGRRRAREDADRGRQRRDHPSLGSPPDRTLRRGRATLVHVGTGDGDGVVLTDDSLRVPGIRDWTCHRDMETIALLWQRFITPRWPTAPLLHMALPIIPAVVDRTAQFLQTGE